MYINGEWIESESKKTREVINPKNGEVIALTAEGTKNDVDMAIEAARVSFYETGDWRRMNSARKGRYIIKDSR